MAKTTDNISHATYLSDTKSKVWNFHNYGVYWCGMRSEIMNAINLQKATEFPITDINHGSIYLWESVFIRKRFLVEGVIQTGGCGTLSKCLRHIERWDTSGSQWLLIEKRVCFLKKPLPPTKSFRKEAMLQIMARTSLEQRGFVGAVPEVYDIFKLPSGEEVFTMEYKDDCIIVHDYFRKNPSFIKSDRLVLTFFFQVAYYLYCLEEDLGMNHRDTKISNLLFYPSTKIREYLWRDKYIKLYQQYDLLLIDFGFACIDELRAGASYLNLDKCPKKGRDFFIFLCMIYTDPTLVSLLSKKVKEWIEEHIKLSKINIFSLINRLSDSQMLAMIYEFSEVFSEFPLCSTEVILDSILTLMGSLGFASPLVSSTIECREPSIFSLLD